MNKRKRAGVARILPSLRQSLMTVSRLTDVILRLSLCVWLIFRNGIGKCRQGTTGFVNVDERWAG